MDVRERDWELFADWCEAMELSALPATPETLDAFVDRCPGSPALIHRRLRTIRARHQAAALTLPRPLPARASTVRHGDGWCTVPETLAQLAALPFTARVRARRDGWLVLLIGTLGLSRRQALAVNPDDITLFPELRIAGRPVPRDDAAESCGACAATRWLRIVDPAIRGERGVVHMSLATSDVHDCAQALDGRWREAPVLVPAIDVHGWVDGGQCLSLTTVSAVMRDRQRRTGAPGAGVRAKAPSGRYAEASSAQLAAAYDDVDRRLSELLARSALVLDDGEQMLTRIEEHRAS